MASDWKFNKELINDNENSSQSSSNEHAPNFPDYNGDGSDSGSGDGKECIAATHHDTGSITSTDQSQEQPSPFSFDNLPDIVIKEILQNIEPLDYFGCGDSYSSLRLICVGWNQVIKNTSELMKKITFPIRNLKEFLNLEIVKQRKIKSISFNEPLEQLELNEESNSDLKTFIDVIINTIEKVTFKFDTNLSQQSELLKLVLTKCNNLQEIIINNNKTFKKVHNTTADADAGILDNIKEDIEIAAANKITSISVNVSKFNEQDAIGLTTLLMKLPHLEKISLFGNYVSSQTSINIDNGLFQYLEKYGKELRLKNLDLKNNPRIPRSECRQAHILLLIMCAKHRVMKERAFKPIDFNSLLDFTDRPAVQEIRPLFPMQINGTFAFEPSSSLTLSNSYRFVGLNVNHLQVTFRRDITDGEFGWIRNILQSLKSLKLHLYICTLLSLGYPKCLGSTSIEELGRVFSTGVPSLAKLDINADIFNPSVGFHWAQYFPNLKELYLESCKFTPDNFIAELIFLECLEHLNLTSLPNLKNAAFTIECVNQFGNNNTPSSSLVAAPAITCFKSLKFLQLAQCPLLTDDCVINGISKCKTLETVNLRCANISEGCCKYITCKYFHSI